MIKELGLRCGNWMKYKLPKDEEEHFGIVSFLSILGGDNIQIHHPFSSIPGPIFTDPRTWTPDLPEYYNFNFLHPIPITPEILKRNEINEDDLPFQVPKYVHELQNLLIDYKIDKDIWI